MIRGITWTFIYNQFGIRSFRGILFHKPVTGQELFFAVSYSKPALISKLKIYLMKTKVALK